MTSAHLIYIPMVVIAGIMIGFILGTRAARNAFDMERKREEERALARARRAERKAKRQQEAEGGGDSAAAANEPN